MQQASTVRGQYHLHMWVPPTVGHGQILSLPQPQLCAGAKPIMLICVQSNTYFQEACATSRYIDGRVWPEDDELEVRLMMDLIRHVTGDQSVHCPSVPLGIIWPCQQHQSLCCISSWSNLLCESVFAYPWTAALSHIPQLPASGLATCVQTCQCCAWATSLADCSSTWLMPLAVPMQV